jgi:histidinol-phosphate/aromatic aminotransferase/cobyric acid decarboxylase-like protein
MKKVVVRLATQADRNIIYRLRHDVYAAELAQHRINSEGAICDSLDEFNQYIVAIHDGQIAGFISITPPGHGEYSIDKYLGREELPYVCDDNLYEVRLLTVMRPFRATFLSGLLMYAAYRWVETHGGTKIMAIGRKEVLDMYLKVGFQTRGRRIQSGAVTFELIHAPVSRLRKHAMRHPRALHKISNKIQWRLDMPFLERGCCEHGGNFFKAIGEKFDCLERRNAIINADVLDAWFPPAPEVLRRLQDNLDWILRTSPPSRCDGMVRAISEARGVPAENIVPAAGSSDIMYLALPHLLSPKSRVLLLDPTYGEYSHIFERLIHCKVDRLVLCPNEDYRIDASRLRSFFDKQYDLVVLVNPNNPTGSHVERDLLQSTLQRAPKTTRFWIDETYTDYVGPNESLERFAAQSETTIVCKSMSKAYALSGARAAYLAAPRLIAQTLMSLTPPWAVSLPAQIAAVTALQHPAYYAQKYAETRRLRSELIAGLQGLGNIAVYAGAANFVLCRLPADGPAAAALIERCQNHGLFLRNTASMTAQSETHGFRIAVKDAETNGKILQILGRVLCEMQHGYSNA